MIVQHLYSLWNLPNCLSTLDGKHGSSNCNYKMYHSIVLLPCCVAGGLFINIKTGYAGRNSDGWIFRASAIKKLDYK